MGAYADAKDPMADLGTNPAENDADAQKELIQQAGWQVTAVNWVYEQVTGENLVEQLITPIAGDFAQIQANAQAWTEVGDALRAVRENLNAGIGELRETWDGSGAVAFETMMVGTWTVALEGDAMLAGLVSKGFELAAQQSEKMTTKALDLIEKLVNRLIEAAATGWVPVAGWANLVRQVVKCIEIVYTIYQLYEAMMAMYDAVVGLIDSIKEAGTNLAKIKEVDSLGEAVNLGFDLKDNATAVQESATAVSDAKTNVTDSHAAAKQSWSERPWGPNSGAGAGGSGGGTGSSGGSDAGYQTLATGSL